MKRGETLRFPWGHRLLNLIDSNGVGVGGEQGAAARGLGVSFSLFFWVLAWDLTSTSGDKMT